MLRYCACMLHRRPMWRSFLPGDSPMLPRCPWRCVRRRVHVVAQSTTSEAATPDFGDAHVAYSGLSTEKLVRAVMVFRLCGWRALVKNSEALLSRSRAVFGDGLVSAVARLTFFGHFCAGEDEHSIAPTVAWLRENGVGAILDYAAEADIEEGDMAEEEQKNRSGVDSARVYAYSTEEECDRNANIFMTAIQSVHNVSPDGFAAIKVTALGNPALLERWSNGLIEIRRLFDRLDTDRDGKLNWEEFYAGWQTYFTGEDEASVRRVFDRFDVTGEGEIDAVEWTTALGVDDMRRLADSCRNEGPFARAALDATEAQLVKDCLARVNKLAQSAEELDVRMMIDAEHSYFQPAIDNIVLELQRTFNKSRPRVFNTFQCYLKETPEKLWEHILRSEREDWQFATKLVRGAYMELERARALELQVDSPIHDTKEDTDACFDAAVRAVLEREAVKTGRSDANCLVATHNQPSIERTIAVMAELGLDRSSGKVYFGQLLGMADHLTFSLGNSGFLAYKYVPYGPVHEVLPYLIRRAQENSDMLGGVEVERNMLWREVMRRILPSALASSSPS